MHQLRGISLLKVHAKCLEKDAAKQISQSWSISSAVSVLAITMQNKYSPSSKFEYDKDLYTCFVDLEKAYTTGFLLKLC